VEIQGSENQLKFVSLIGVHGVRGSVIPELFRLLSSLKPNPNLDTVDASVWRSMIIPEKDASGLSWRKIQADMGMSYCGNTLFKHGLSRERLGKVAQVIRSETLTKLAQSDIYWDEIVKITPQGLEEVFDLTVPSEHNFIANDLVVHNSIEQDADVVMFLYRDDYYNKNREEHDHLVEVLVSKHRNGPTGDVRLSAQFQYSRFYDLDLRESGKS
jgi:replicative DNA helicase